MLYLDVTTLNLVLFLVGLGNWLLSCLVAVSGRKFRGAWLWVLGQAFLALGALLLAIRPEIPLWVPVVFGNGFFLLSCILFAHSLWVFQFSRPFPRWLYLFFIPILASLFLVLGDPLNVRIVVFSFWAVLGSAFVGFLVLRKIEPGFLGAKVVTAFPFFLVSLASLLRLVFNLAPAQVESFYRPSTPNAVYLLGAVLISTVTLFGYFMMARLKFEREVKEKDLEIQKRNSELLELGRSKDLFFSIIAHDLRGPIGGAARYVRKHLLGKMTGLESKYFEVETVAAALEKTYDFLEKLLWWSRAQLQDWVPIQEKVDVEKVLAQAVSLVESNAELKKIRLEIPEGPFPSPLADTESVNLILGNLLSNAVKFSFPGHAVRLEVTQTEGICQIAVVDHGVGMDQATLDRLFRIEAKLTTHGTSGERGSGLGLLLAQSLAQRNGGGVLIESQPGIGTRAILWLPCAEESLPEKNRS
jgi:signal transduction histidine kinase